jgi:hypothetical protein
MCCCELKQGGGRTVRARWGVGSTMKEDPSCCVSKKKPPLLLGCKTLFMGDRLSPKQKPGTDSDPRSR